jgi:CheY-like chemotaxis protein
VRILFVDDDADSLRVYGTILASCGYDVTGALSGVDAIDELTRDPSFDIVVTDYDMPGIKGDTTLSLIRARWPDLPVILISSHDGLDERARDIGAAAYLHKPCPADTLLRTLRKLSRKPL